MKRETRTILIINLCLAVLIAGVIVSMILLPKQKKEAEPNPTSLQTLFEGKEKVLIDCLGDSITWGMFSSPELEQKIASGEIQTGYGDGGQENLGIYVSGAFQSKPSYPEVLEQQLNQRLSRQGEETTVQTVNDGLSGDWITETTYERMTCDPDLVILLMGGNNYYFGYPIEGMFEANLRHFQEKKIPVFLVNYALYPGEYHEAAFRNANEWMAKIAEEWNLPLFDFYSYIESLVYEGEGEAPEGMYRRDDLFSPDRIHLSEKGYELLGCFVAESLMNEIAPKQ